MSLVVVGSFGIDTIETPFGRAEDVVGGSAVYFSLAASLFSQVKLAGNIGSDFPQAPLQILKKRGADLSGIQMFRDQATFRWTGRYEGEMNEAETLRTELNVIVEPPKIPDNYIQSPFVFLANMGPSTQLEVLDTLQGGLVFADTMNLWIDTALTDLHQVINKVDGLILNDAEARALTGETHLILAGEALLEMGPDTVIIKKGEHGAFLFTDGLHFALPAYPTSQVVDPTGAGDSFAGGFLGALAEMGEVTPANLRRAMAYGTVAASMTVEHFSTRGLEAAVRDCLDRRFQELQDFVQFSS